VWRQSSPGQQRQDPPAPAQPRRRQANAALRRITLVRLNCDPRTKDYLAKRITDGKSKTEAIRCLKRYIAREVFSALPIPARP